MILFPGNRMDAPGGPECACGKPSTYESGWCGECDQGRMVGDVISDAPLHALWTKAVGTPDYDKSQWIKLERIIHELKHENRELRKKLAK
jgi:hypothetical protein